MFTNSLIPNEESSLPQPDSFIPPNGSNEILKPANISIKEILFEHYILWKICPECWGRINH
jgi:hypothetical protein